MGKLEATEVRLEQLKIDNGELRIDAEYYSKKFVQNEVFLQKLKTEKFEKFCNFIKKGIFDLSPNFYQNYGIPLIRTSEIKQPLIDFSTTVYLDKQTNEENHNTILYPGDLVFTKIGAYIGDVAMCQTDFLQYNFSQNVAGVSLKNKKLGAYLLCFFLSKYGRFQILRSAMLSGQGKLELKDIRNYKIPILPAPFQNKIAEMVKSAHNKLEQSKLLYKQAEEILERELEIDFESLTKKKSVEFSIVNSQSSIFSSGRLDAEYYQEKYDKIENAIKKYKGGWNYLNAVTKIYDKNILPSDNVFYSYIELANIGANGEINGCTKSLGVDLPTRARRLVHSGDVLVSSIEGSLQSCAIVGEEFDGAFCSTGFYVLSPEKLNKETLLLLMKSSPIQALLKRGCNGTILTSISKEEFSEIPIPIIPKDIQSAIAEKITESFRLREESKQLLEDAKLAVEREIEK